MRRLLTTTAIVVGALWCWTPVGHAVETIAYCGPQTEGGVCELPGPDFMIFGQGQKDATILFGNVGSQNGLPVVKFTSDGGTLQMFLDISNGFATIKPTQGASTFNGLDITLPGDAAHPFGFGFTQLAFDEQLTPDSKHATTENFILQGFTGSHSQVGLTGNESDAPDTDKEFSITAIGGTLDEVNIASTTGFDEMKHFEIGGVCAFTDATDTTCTPVVITTPEPASLGVLGLGFSILALTRLRRRSS